jgi:[acyl-carrier-protein] S-malonyltransferase
VVTSAEAARDALIRQVTGSVKWDPTVRLLIEKGVRRFVEVGPGKVLWGLMRQIDRVQTCLTVGDESSLQKTLSAISAAAV